MAKHASAHKVRHGSDQHEVAQAVGGALPALPEWHKVWEEQLCEGTKKDWTTLLQLKALSYKAASPKDLCPCCKSSEKDKEKAAAGYRAFTEAFGVALSAGFDVNFGSSSLLLHVLKNSSPQVLEDVIRAGGAIPESVKAQVSRRLSSKIEDAMSAVRVDFLRDLGLA